jgi:hypothetical protein
MGPAGQAAVRPATAIERATTRGVGAPDALGVPGQHATQRRIQRTRRRKMRRDSEPADGRSALGTGLATVVVCFEAPGPGRSSSAGLMIALRAAPSHMSPMPYHRFKVGQTVVAPTGGPDALIPRGPLTIMRLMPLADGEPQYRVHSSGDGLERVIRESQLRPMEETLNERHTEQPEHAKRPRRHRRH